MQLNLELEPLLTPIKASALDGHLLERVTHCIQPVHMSLTANHHETIHFFLSTEPTQLRSHIALSCTTRRGPGYWRCASPWWFVCSQLTYLSLRLITATNDE